jgi:hypothetical protein
MNVELKKLNDAAPSENTESRVSNIIINIIIWVAWI